MVLAQSPPVPAPARRQAAVTSGLVATVVFLAAIAPLATDMYVPAFPSVAGDLSATATQVQLTLTTFFVGMALGQLIGGPVLVAVPESLPAERRHGGGIPNGGALASAEVPAHPGPGRRSSASSSGSRPAPSRRSPGSAASTPPYAWHCS